MLRLDNPSRRRVTLWRPTLRRQTSGLLVVSLLSLLLGQPFHERVASDAGADAAAVVASGAGAPGGLPAHPDGHDRDHCVQCRAVAQTRLGLRALAPEGVLSLDGPSRALHPQAPACPRAAPEPCLAGPRAPPASLLA